MQYLFRRTVSIPAGATLAPIAGDLISRLPTYGYLEIGINEAAGSLTYSAAINGRQIALNQQSDVGAGLPNVQQLPISNEIVMAADVRGQLTLDVTNPTAGALNANIHVRLAQTPRQS